MTKQTLSPSSLRGTAMLLTLLASGCSGLLPKPVAPPSVYALGGFRATRDALPASASTSAPTSASTSAPTLLLSATRSAPGYGSQHIVYVRVAHQLEHFARSVWVDSPARMLEPLMVAALEQTGAFRAVGSATRAIAGELRLDTEVLRLQHEFGGGPSRVRFTLRASLTDNATRQVISTREFDATVAADSDDPYGGVVAANRAVRQVLQQLASYCAEAVALGTNGVSPTTRRPITR